jgi:2-polyprenyl-3-methyl-5-hydroxy-6-metoxy-1,4-benzoquinol methylase
MSLKKNVERYNKDIETENGYGYTQDIYYSAYLVNTRVMMAITKYIRSYDSEIHTVIDIGCGDGTNTNEIKKLFPDKQVTGFDPAAKAIDVAKKKYPYVIFFVEDAHEYSLNPEEQQYDLAIMSSVLHHSANPEEVIKTVSSYAKKILIIEPNGNNFVRKILEKTSSYYIEHEEVSFKPKTVKGWCEKAGYTINPIEHFGFIPLFFPETLSRIIWFFTPTLEKIPLIKHYLSGACVISGSRPDRSEPHDWK